MWPTILFVKIETNNGFNNLKAHLLKPPKCITDIDTVFCEFHQKVRMRGIERQKEKEEKTKVQELI